MASAATGDVKETKSKNVHTLAFAQSLRGFKGPHHSTVWVWMDEKQQCIYAARCGVVLGAYYNHPGEKTLMFDWACEHVAMSKDPKAQLFGPTERGVVNAFFIGTGRFLARRFYQALYNTHNSKLEWFGVHVSDTDAFFSGAWKAMFGSRQSVYKWEMEMILRTSSIKAVTLTTVTVIPHYTTFVGQPTSASSSSSSSSSAATAVSSDLKNTL